MNGGCRMAMWLSDSADEAKPLGRIDLTPMIGVLAALLAIFVLQVPETHFLRMPSASIGDGPPPPPGTLPPPPIDLIADAEGRITWNGIALLPDEFEDRLAALDRLNEHPEIYFRAPPHMHFQHLAEVAAAAQRHHFFLGLGAM